MPPHTALSRVPYPNEPLKFRSTAWLTILLLCAAFFAHSHQAQSAPLVIADVTVIDPRSRTVREHMSITIDNGRIAKIQPASAKTPPGAAVHSGKGKFVIPGLWDAHVHLSKAGDIALPLFLANGVTSVRDMGSNFEQVNAWRSEIGAGKRVGPRIRTPGRILEARANVERMKKEGTVEPVDRIRIGVANPEEGRSAVVEAARLGVDFIKMRTTPDLATFQAVADEARRQKLPFAAHFIASPEELTAARISSVEHLIAYPPLAVRPAAERTRIYEAMAKARVFMSTTMANLEGSILVPHSEARPRVDDVDGKLDARRRYLCGYLIEDWREQVEENKSGDMEPIRGAMNGIIQDMRDMREAGVPFLGGTDVALALIYPGFSLHDELHNLVAKVGWTPMEALRIATHNPTEWFGSQAEGGAIAEGQLADLVLLDANPLTDIRNSRRIHAVVFGGRWMGQPSLRDLLSQVEKHAKTDCSATSITVQ